MDNIIQSTPLPLPQARVNITIRPGTMDDLPFIDSLQKKTTKQVGWMPTKQFEGKIKAGHVLVACATETADRSQETGEMPSSPISCLLSPVSSPVGYLIGQDQYFKRDDVGIIYQINVLPEYRRSLVAASLLKAQFDRSAYGCKLYCCWCAQDIEANRFWESMGFVALAFRAGSEKKARTHVFWQKRIRAGDETTPWWFPSKTAGGAIREDRIVLPIPHGTRWSDEMPRLLPGDGQMQIHHEDTKSAKGAKELKLENHTSRVSSRSSCLRGENDLGEKRSPTPQALSGGMHFAPPTPIGLPKQEKPKRPPRQKVKVNPMLVLAARELRDRWLEEVNDGRHELELMAKYEVQRVSDDQRLPIAGAQMRLLEAA